MNDTHRMHPAGAVGGGRLEHELRSWLRSFDPGELAVDERVAIARDLSLADAEGDRRGAWRKRTLVVTAAAAAVVALLLLSLATLVYPIAGDGQIGAPSGPAGLVDPTPGHPVDEIYGPVLDPIALGALLGLCLLGGAAAFSARARSFFGRVLFGATPEPSPGVLPFRRHGLPRMTWVLAAVAAVYIGFAAYVVASPGAFFPLGGWTVAVGLVTVPAVVLMCVAVPIRYSLALRSSWLLIVGVAAPLSVEPLVLIGNSLSLTSPLFSAVITLAYCMGPCALAAGLARRAGTSPAPPQRLAAGVVVASFAIQLLPMTSAMPFQPVEWILLSLGLGMLDVARTVALVSSLWICVSTARRGGSAGWLVLGVALSASLLQWFPWRAMVLVATFVPGFFAFSEQSMLSNAVLETLMVAVNTAAMAAGLLIGLRRPPEADAEEPQPEDPRSAEAV